MAYIETSALSNINVDDAFMTLAKKIVENSKILEGNKANNEKIDLKNVACSSTLGNSKSACC